MNGHELSLRYEERVVFALRSLYSRYGYSQYKMKKFEEYDFYVKNKDFLISDSVITFTDTNGKLLALKPDVTLSIVKNSRPRAGAVEKLYYNENVYRVSEGTRRFRELMQVGLECIGDLDDYALSEVITLASKSLLTVSPSAILGISHLGILASVLDRPELSEGTRSAAYRCIAEKNGPALRKLCETGALSPERASLIESLISAYGDVDEVLPRLLCLSDDPAFLLACERFSRVLSFVKDPSVKRMLKIDFSVVSDTNYYNGIAFKGFLEGAPDSVLSGGQYDRLMQRMGKSAGAIGFAIYLDRLDAFKSEGEGYEQDVILLYDDESTPEALAAALDALFREGRSVLAMRSLPERLTYRCLMKLEKGEVKILEEYA